MAEYQLQQPRALLALSEVYCMVKNYLHEYSHRARKQWRLLLTDIWGCNC